MFELIEELKELEIRRLELLYEIYIFEKYDLE